MPRIEVFLSENDVHNACRDWAVTRILNEGKAVSSEIHVTVFSGKPNGTITSVTVGVETVRMGKNMPNHIVDAGLKKEKV